MTPETEKRKESINRFRGIVHIGMGILYLLVGIAVLILEAVHQALGSTAAYILGSAMAAYGIFRIYRGSRRMKGDAEGW